MAIPASSEGVIEAEKHLERFVALRNPTFRLYWFASICSSLGDTFEAVVRNWLVWELTGSPFWLGIANFCHWLPFSFLGLHAGVLADRVDNRKLIRISEFFYLSSAVIMAVLVLTETVSLPLLFVLLVLHGVGGGMSQPSRQVLVHNIVGREALLNAVSLNSSARQCLQIIGPPFAGWALVTLGAGWGYVITAAMFLPLVATLTVIRVERTHQKRDASALSAWNSLKEGLRYVQSQPVLIGMLAMAVTPTILLGSSFHSMLPYFADRVFHTGATGYSFFLSASGVGAVLGAFFLSFLRTLTHKGRVVVGCLLAYALLVVGFALLARFIPVSVAALILAAAGMSWVIFNTSTNTLLQLAAPDAVRGRVMGLYSLSTFGLQVFNGPAVGTLAALLGVPAALSIVAGGILAVTVAIALCVPALRSID
jgi:MFS family permease